MRTEEHNNSPQNVVFSGMANGLKQVIMTVTIKHREKGKSYMSKCHFHMLISPNFKS